MPIEIRELYIKVSVETDPKGKGSKPQDSGSASGAGKRKAAAGGADSRETVREAVEQVFDVLRAKKDR